MKSGITEFSYGFSLTYELVSHYGFASAAPEFPNLRQEAKLGYDVRLQGGGTPVFLQFKLSEYLTRGTAAAARFLGVPHYRFWLMSSRHSAQHSRLLSLERLGQVVLYAAPIFHTAGELDAAFNRRTMVSKSAFFRPRSIGEMPDDGEHSISFTDHGLHACRLSEPMRFERTDGAVLFREYAQSRLVRDNSFLEGANIRALGELIIGLIREGANSEWSDASEAVRPSVPETPLQLLMLSRIYLGAELIFV